MPPPPTSLYTLSLALALLLTLLVAGTLRLLAILPPRIRTQWRKRPVATRVLIVLGSGGHTHEMFYLLRDLDTSKYTHRTYVVSSGDAFSAQRAVEFERGLEEKEKEKEKEKRLGALRQQDAAIPSVSLNGKKLGKDEGRKCTGPEHYNVAVIPRARRIHQSLLSTPFSAMRTLLSSIPILLSSPPLLPNKPPSTPYESAAQDLPDLIITNGPATGVIVILGSLILRFFNFRGANSRGKCKTIYAESFARVKGLSLSGKLLSRVVDRFLVQWEELEGSGGGRGEFWGVLV
ncbi:UDP-N-acetylglucosamine transferase subunit ALG14 [Parastagonospora nodorum]|nr:UDP-N-acetylglucosamine transferase subunit ALG14 [Parastagonospora nodorum]